MPDLYKYSKSFEPLFLEGYTARLFGTGLPTNGLAVECVASGALPEYLKDFGALTAGLWSSEMTDTNLEMPKWELSQMRMRVIDDMRIRLKNSSSVQQWRTNATTFFLPQFPAEPNHFLAEYYFMASEFFSWERYYPYFTFYSDFTLATARVLFSGWRFKMQATTKAPRFNIWINDWPSVTENKYTQSLDYR